MTVRKRLRLKRAATASAREKTAEYLRKVVKKILRRFQHGHIKRRHLPIEIRRQLQAKGFRIHSQVSVDRQSKNPNTVCVSLTASRRTITLPMIIERTHSRP